LREKGRNRDDDELLGRVAELVKTLTNPHRDSFVNTEQYEKLKSGGCKRLSVHSLLKPSVIRGFGSVFIAGANFQDTAQYRLWSDMGVGFREDQEFVAGLRFQSHQDGDLIDIHYAMESPWSKKRRDGGIGDVGQDSNLVRIARAARHLFGNDPFVWQANKDILDGLFPAPTAERLPNKPHGLNCYAGVNNIVVLSALNPAPDHFKFLETLGLSGADVRTAAYHAAAYQSVMRTSIREPSNRERKTIVVPDRPLAEYLQQRFPGSRIHILDAGIVEDAKTRRTGRPRKYQSNRDRMAEQRARDKEESLRILNEQIALSLGHGNFGAGLCAEMGIRLITNIRTQPLPVQGTLYRGKFTGWPSAYVAAADEECFVGFLRACHSKRVATKDDLRLISPAIFDPARPGTTKNRGLENIVYLRHLWLDFEDGDLRPEEFAALFPNVRLVVTNSFHHKSDKPRFRAVILTDRSLTREAHELLFDNVARKIEGAGYFINRRRKNDKTIAGANGQSGLDWSKRTPASLFYLPCQAADPRDSLFIDFAGPEREILNPLPWIENSVVPVVPVFDLPEHPKNDGTKVDEALLQQARDEWRQSLQFPQEGNDRFFDFARALRRAGLSPHQIQSVLQTEAAFGRSPKERRGQVKSIMSSLARRRRRSS
jgi:hypothetical protein